MAEHSNYLRYVRATILRQPGGHARWQALGPVVEQMTDLQQREMLGALTEAERTGKQLEEILNETLAL